MFEVLEQAAQGALEASLLKVFKICVDMSIDLPPAFSPVFHVKGERLDPLKFTVL